MVPDCHQEVKGKNTMCEARLFDSLNSVQSP